MASLTKELVVVLRLIEGIQIHLLDKPKRRFSAGPIVSSVP